MNKPTPNIGRTGRAARGVSGVLFLLIAVHALVFGYPGLAEPIRWIVAGLSLVFGGFQVFEALSGWCVMRAMGFRTPM